MLGLGGKTVLVTGGSRGIGRATSILLAEAGARVAVHYHRDSDAAAEVARACGPDARVFPAALGDAAAGQALVEAVEQAMGPLDVLVVNHGIWKPAAIDTMTPAEWAETLETNLTGAWAVCQAAARSMKARRTGRIVTVASTAGQRGEAGHSHYAASKGALLAFTKSLAAELAPFGVRVNGVAPGWVLTDMTRHVFEGPEAARIAKAIPVGRPGKPAEIAACIAFLASDLSSYVIGEILDANGGSVMTG